MISRVLQCQSSMHLDWLPVIMANFNNFVAVNPCYGAAAIFNNKQGKHRSSCQA